MPTVPARPAEVASGNRQMPLFCQRWRDRQEYRLPARGVICPSDYRVEVLEQRQAKPFVTQHHYAGTFPAARLSVGLFTASRPQLVGVAVFGVPMNQAVIPRHLGVLPGQGIELSRLVLLDWVPGNAESWFVSRAFRLLRMEKPEIQGVVSYCDPVPRATAQGQMILPGHVGTVYQSLNAAYLGRSSARTLLMAPSGRVVSQRAISKVRRQESGAGYAERQLVEAGAPSRKPGESRASWVTRALDSDRFRVIRHPGNHVYAFGLTRNQRRQLPPSPDIYPKALG